MSCPHCSSAHPRTWSHCPTTGKPLTTGPALVGRVIAGRYRIRGLLGEGGMGAVYEAEHLAVGRRVALKRLHPELATDASSVSRFQREARAAGATGHEHVVDVLDLGFAEDGAPYLVMELLAGESLAQRLARQRLLPSDRAASIAGQVLSALEAVHALDVIHRDLKPDNIFLTRRGGRSDYVKVLDFGVSKMAADSKDPKLTRTGMMVGTPHYMSPEQARGVRQLDHRVDLYAVGVILFECLAGQLPFHADNYHALLQSILAREAPSLVTLVPTIDPKLAAVVARALAKRPEDRYPDARAMWEALVPFGAPQLAEIRSSHPPPSAGAPRPGAATESLAMGRMPTSPMEASMLASKLEEARPAFGIARPRAASALGGGLSPVTLATPAPLDPAPTPPTWSTRSDTRRFVAQSADWSDSRADLLTFDASRLRSTDAPRERSTPTGRRFTARPDAPIVDEAPPSPGRLKGALLLGVLGSLRAKHGANAVEAVLASLGDDRRTFGSGLVPVAWVDDRPARRLLETIERQLGGADGRACRTFGRELAKRELPRTHRLLLRSAPDTAIAKLPVIWRSYAEGSQIQLDPSETGSVRIDVEAGPQGWHFLHVMAGVVEGFLELCGAREVKVSVVERSSERASLSVRWR
ncbi:MAG: DUF2378 family protein [Myxococcales bacterium]|nr:DUF2378 family protein [Myxococcales bacterium]